MLPYNPFVQDVIIIGAGPAGSCAAILLARQGRTVTLIEQHRYPRNKVCGECLSSLGLATLGRLGMTRVLLDSGAVSLERAVIHRQDGDSISTSLPGQMLGISRSVLDAILLAAAGDAGVKILQPARSEGLVDRGDHVEMNVRDLAANSIFTLQGRIGIVADGKGAMPKSSPPSTGDVGIKAHWTGIAGPANAIELFGCADCYGGLAPIEGGRWNVACSVPASRLRVHRGNVDSLFTEMLTENRGFARRLFGGVRGGPWLASPLPRFSVRRHWPARVIPVGNAAAALEPIGGEGMGLALRSAELAVEALCAAGDWSARMALTLQDQYAKLWRSRRLACRAAGWIVSSPLAADVAFDWINANPSLVGAAMEMMGKGATGAGA
jgi:2-polyprenyl-6-methoxyphenol hydroxylase-like FAD-dependent oxidoreductase